MGTGPGTRIGTTRGDDSAAWPGVSSIVRPAPRGAGAAARQGAPLLVVRRADSELTRTARRGPRSGADVGREVLAGEGGAVGDEVGGCALEDDPAAVVAGAGAEVDDPVGV